MIVYFILLVVCIEFADASIDCAVDPSGFGVDCSLLGTFRSDGFSFVNLDHKIVDLDLCSED